MWYGYFPNIFVVKKYKLFKYYFLSIVFQAFHYKVDKVTSTLKRNKVWSRSRKFQKQTCPRPEFLTTKLYYLSIAQLDQIIWNKIKWKTFETRNKDMHNYNVVFQCVLFEYNKEFWLLKLMVIISLPMLTICCSDFLAPTPAFFYQHQPCVKHGITPPFSPSHSAPESAL